MAVLAHAATLHIGVVHHYQGLNFPVAVPEDEPAVLHPMFATGMVRGGS